MDEDLVAILSEESFLPKDGLRRAMQQPEAIAKPVLDVLALAGDEPAALTDEDSNLLFWGLHVLAHARDTRLFAPLLKAMRHDADTLDILFGDALTHTLPLVLSSSFDGDAPALHRFILDGTIDDVARSAAIATLGFLTREGRLDRQGTRDLLVRYDEARVAAEETGWLAWEETIAYLGLAELAPRVEAARKDGRITDEVSDLGWFRKALRQASAEPPNLSAFEGSPFGYLDDPVAALAWTAEAKPAVNPFKDVGRNDPCPCGSGKKYKKCCLGSAAQAAPVTAPLPGSH